MGWCFRAAYCPHLQGRRASQKEISWGRLDETCTPETSSSLGIKLQALSGLHDIAMQKTEIFTLIQLPLSFMNRFSAKLFNNQMNYTETAGRRAGSTRDLLYSASSQLASSCILLPVSSLRPVSNRAVSFSPALVVSLFRTAFEWPNWPDDCTEI
jgi:hypothetical protein